MPRPVLYADMLSQPCRAVVVLCQQNGIDIEIKPISIGRGEHRSADFKAVNPLCKLPYLVVRLVSGMGRAASNDTLRQTWSCEIPYSFHRTSWL